MPRLTMEGGKRLEGTVSILGAKNAALPILAAAILVEGHFNIDNVPQLKDVVMMIKMLNALGVRAEYHPPQTVKIWNHKKIRHIAPYELVTAMRASFFVAGPILARTGYAKIPLPGGCSIGTRPIDLHLDGFKALGATIEFEHGFVEIKAKKLVGKRIHLKFPSVGATENIMMAATLAEGTTVIENAAQEPEISDLAHFLNKAGAKISGIDSQTITIEGVTSLSNANYSIIPDRIEAGTLLIAGAITQGDVTVNNIVPEHLEALTEKLIESGAELTINKDSIRIVTTKPPKAIDFETLPHPGFATDMQAQMMAYLTIAEGKCIVKETIFENRFMHANELNRMGADIKIDGRTAIVTGVKELSGAEVKITDLRAGAALILAGLAADGKTTVHGLKHLNRGYFNLPAKLKSLGANILG